MRRRTEGFSLIEVVVAVAIMAILAGAIVPLAMKSLIQQRTATTQATLETTWQTLFGSQTSRVYNMRADFGFDPPASTLTSLPQMITQPATSPVYGSTATPFNWGWNGPYWNGPVGQVAGVSVPVDTWGNAIQLVYTAIGNKYQLVSSGGGRPTLFIPACP